MTVPDFKKFGVNTYRGRLIQRGNTVILAQRTWLAAIALSAFGAIVAFFFIVPMIMKGDYTLTPGRVLAIIFFLFLEGGSIACALYRAEIYFDFGGRYYRIRKGFIWNIKEFHGFFEDIIAVIVRESHMSGSTTGAPRRVYSLFHIEIEFKKESPTFDIWEAQSREQADYISRTLADAFGCEVKWEKSLGIRMEEKLREKIRGRRS